MHGEQPQSCTAFAGSQRVACGELKDVAEPCKALVDAGQTVLVFDDATAEPIEMDFRGSVQDVLQRLTGVAAETSSLTREPQSAPAPRTPGRPKLGVVGREITLLPRHWEWLNAQPGGASVALRRLVDQARRTNADRDRVRGSQEVAFRFMSAMAGDEPGFEEASRALFAGDGRRFDEHAASWPADVRDYARMLAADSFADQEASPR